jgi:carbonic anhydrase
VNIQGQGTLKNWGYGFLYNLTRTNAPWIIVNENLTLDSYAANLKASRRQNTLLMKQFHYVHIPSEHIFNGARAMAEMHLAHVDRTSNRKPKAVIALMINLGHYKDRVTLNPFFDWFSSIPPIWSLLGIPIQNDFRYLFGPIDYLADYWTYMGSLTTVSVALPLNF